MLSELVRNAMIQRSMQPIWEGLVRHQWSETQLLEIEKYLEQSPILTPGLMRGTLIHGILNLEQMRTQSELDWCTFSVLTTDVPIPHFLIPDGWFYQNQISFTQNYLELVLPVLDASNQRVYPSKAHAAKELLKKEYGGSFSPSRFLNKHLFLAKERRVGFDLFLIERSHAIGQTRLNQARIACALERYRLANGRFPETLNALSPTYMSPIPLDLITGEPLKYRCTKEEQFILYSVGWNEKDDGGTTATTANESSEIDLSEGDWVWHLYFMGKDGA